MKKLGGKKINLFRIRIQRRELIYFCFHDHSKYRALA